MDQALIDLTQRHVAAENAHDMEATLGTLHPDCVFEDFAMGRVWRGHAGATAHYRDWWSGLDTEVLPRGRRAFLNDGSMIAETGFRCRHIGTFLGVPATGHVFELPFVVVVSYRDGLMHGERFYYSLDRLLAGLGAATRPQYAGQTA